MLFHGAEARQNLKALFAQTEFAQKLAVINKQALDNSTGSAGASSKKDKKLTEILERISIGMKKGSHEVHQNVLSLLLEHSRLAYSGFTIKLFNRITNAAPVSANRT